jgi:hypothetical protein
MSTLNSCHIIGTIVLQSVHFYFSFMRINHRGMSYILKGLTGTDIF